jgi:hypothetical protein
MRQASLPLAGFGILLSGLSAQAIPQGPTAIDSVQAGVRYGSPTFIQEGLPTQTARAVSAGFVRSNTLLPLGGTEVIANPVPDNLSDLSGWSRDQLQAGLNKDYDVDVAAVSRFLYSEKGEAFLSESIRQNNYTPYYSQQNSLQAVRSAIILDSADGKLSSYGMMANLPTDQRLQGAMTVCDVNNVGANNVNNSNVTGRNKTQTTTTIKTSNKRVNKTKVLILRNKITTLKAILAILAMANSVHTAKYLITHKKNAEKE